MLPLPIEVIAGACAGVLLFRLGLPHLIPLLVWVPLAHVFVSIGFMMGLISSSVWQLSRPLFSRGQSFPFGVLISLACAGAGLSLVEWVLPFLFLVEGIISPLLVAAVLWVLFFSSHGDRVRILVIGCGVLALVLGWFSLRVWAIPLALPALLLGLFGFSSVEQRQPTAAEEMHPLRESVVGVILGILPGLGPGLMGVWWGSSHFSPFTGIANLIFSLGYVALSGKIRSAPAELLSSTALGWNEIFLVIVCGVFMAWGFEQLLPLFSFSLPLSFWSFLHVVALIFLGSASTLLLAIAALAWSRAAHEWGVFPSLGLLVLIPPIVWFYS